MSDTVQITAHVKVMNISLSFFKYHEVPIHIVRNLHKAESIVQLRLCYEHVFMNHKRPDCQYVKTHYMIALYNIGSVNVVMVFIAKRSQ